ncbi:MAG: hypothetical protein M3519_10125 [Actinomycetota bacterium]|nr:hypothetical protein [Actinomycetota bacterium]
MQRVTASARMWLACAVALLLAGVSGAALLTTPGHQPTGMQVLVSPHPDDDLLAWAALEDDPATYTVLLTLTRGEHTRQCDRPAQRTQEDAGERAPEPVPTGRDTDSCAAARINSWQTFLGQAAEQTPEIALGASERHTFTDPRVGGRADVRAGTNSARIALSLPDGQLTEDAVVAGVEAVLEQRGDVLPDLPVRRLLSASYWNDSAERGSRTSESGDCVERSDCPGEQTAFEYENLDHRETTLAMPSLARHAQLGAWVTVPPGENRDLLTALGTPDGSTWRQLSLDPEVYDYFMELGPVTDGEPRRLGLQQRVYGWLAFPGQWWEAGDQPRADNDVLFPREQTFLVLPGGEG